MKRKPTFAQKATHRLWKLKAQRTNAVSVADGELPLVVCTVFRNEAPFLKEWLNFHIERGVAKFYLADNHSTDDFQRVLQPFIQKGIVKLVRTQSPKMDAFIQAMELNRLLALAREEQGSKAWAAIIDVDEFLFGTTQTVKHILEAQRGKSVGAVLVNWLFFGTSKVAAIDPKKPFLAQFTHRAKADLPEHKKVKPICYLKNTVGFYGGPHIPFVANNAIVQYGDATAYLPEEGYITHSPLRINHYWFRSEEYFNNQKRFNRKRFSSIWDTATEKRFVEACNAVEDKSILKLI